MERQDIPRHPQTPEPVISTLGPLGTDSAHEAAKRSPQVRLFSSFPAAVDHALRTDGQALVPAGYLDIQDGTLADTWVDLHFRMLDRLRVVDVWKSPTKPMCLALNPDRVTDPASVRSVATHPATAVLARQSCAAAEVTFVRSKPLAVELAASGRVDACIGSVDVVAETSLNLVESFYPTMVWILYEAASKTPTDPTLMSADQQSVLREIEE